MSSDDHPPHWGEMRFSNLMHYDLQRWLTHDSLNVGVILIVGPPKIPVATRRWLMREHGGHIRQRLGNPIDTGLTMGELERKADDEEVRLVLIHQEYIGLVEDLVDGWVASCFVYSGMHPVPRLLKPKDFEHPEGA